MWRVCATCDDVFSGDRLRLRRHAELACDPLDLEPWLLALDLGDELGQEGVAWELGQLGPIVLQPSLGVHLDELPPLPLDALGLGLGVTLALERVCLDLVSPHRVALQAVNIQHNRGVSQVCSTLKAREEWPQGLTCRRSRRGCSG
jgi:hypothetical protein